MGYTLVTGFTPENYAFIEEALHRADIHGNNKVPYGRVSDRAPANAALPYHMTVCHWGSEEKLLEKVRRIRFMPCSLKLVKADVMGSSKNGYVLYLKVQADKYLSSVMSEMKRIDGLIVPGEQHITIDISKDKARIDGELERLNAVLKAPVEFKVRSLDLYHIWTPVHLLCKLQAEPA